MILNHLARSHALESVEEYMIKSEDVMVVWTPNREPFSRVRTAGTVAITKIPQDPAMRDHPMSAGACDIGWKNASVDDRRRKVNEWRKQMVEEDNIPADHADKVLGQIDWS